MSYLAELVERKENGELPQEYEDVVVNKVEDEPNDELNGETDDTNTSADASCTAVRDADSSPNDTVTLDETPHDDAKDEEVAGDQDDHSSDDTATTAESPNDDVKEVAGEQDNPVTPDE